MEPLSVVKVVGTVLRHTVGYQNQFGGRRSSAPLSYSYIQNYSGVSSRADVSQALKVALKNGYIARVQTGRFHSNAEQRQAARYAVKWRICEPVAMTGSISEPADLSKKRTSTSSESVPANRSKNRTKEKTLTKHTDKQQAAAADDSILVKLLAEGIDRKTATVLLRDKGPTIAQNQIEWLDARNPIENRVGMLRKAIEEDWSKPASVAQRERQIRQREHDQRQTEKERQEAASIAATKRERSQRKKALSVEWENASEEDRQRWIQMAVDRETSSRIADIIRRDSAMTNRPHRQVLDAIAADRNLPPVTES